MDASDATMDQAVLNLRTLILAGEHHRQIVAAAVGLGTTESRVLSYLAVHGDSGQSELARDLGLTSSASTALVDRLERQGVAERSPHPQDRRRSMVRLTERGLAIVSESREWLGATLGRLAPDQLQQVSTALATLADDLSTRTSGNQVHELFDPTQALPE